MLPRVYQRRINAPAGGPGRVNAAPAGGPGRVNAAPAGVPGAGGVQGRVYQEQVVYSTGGTGPG